MLVFGVTVEGYVPWREEGERREERVSADVTREWMGEGCRTGKVWARGDAISAEGSSIGAWREMDLRVEAGREMMRSLSGRGIGSGGVFGVSK